MFDKSAHLYDLLYSFKDYQGEAEALARLVKGLHPGAASLLDVACGTHEHARWLTAHFAVDGVDLNPVFLDVAREKNPKGRYTLGDMRTLDLGRRYDAVVCLFSSIGYVQSVAELDAAIARFAAHLAPGGLVVVEPWFTPERWKEGHVAMRAAEDEHTKVARMNVTVREGNTSPIRFHYMVATPEGVETFTEDHRMTLFTPEEMRASFEKAGLELRDAGEWPGDRGLYVGQAPQ